MGPEKAKSVHRSKLVLLGGGLFAFASIAMVLKMSVFKGRTSEVFVDQKSAKNLNSGRIFPMNVETVKALLGKSSGVPLLLPVQLDPDAHAYVEGVKDGYVVVLAASEECAALEPTTEDPCFNRVVRAERLKDSKIWEQRLALISSSVAAATPTPQSVADPEDPDSNEECGKARILDLPQQLKAIFTPDCFEAPVTVEWVQDQVKYTTEGLGIEETTGLIAAGAR
jgi:hypothetical protein